MSLPEHIAVIDIGKTNAKVVLFDLAAAREVAAHRMANLPLAGPPFRHFDVERLWQFVCTSLADLDRSHGIDAISITTHGACFVALDASNRLALPVMDYEDPAPETTAEAYAAVRPAFAESGSPRLPMGLNAGAMLRWQMATMPDAWARVRHILPWPQYWAFRLTGTIATEVTSLGVHTDLWNPHTGRYSSMVEALGWENLMPPIRAAGDCLGGVVGEACALGVRGGIPVHCGIHDSNASLLPHLLTRPAPFSVLSTGTWVVTLAVGAKAVELDERRDTLINVNARGEKTPSARFMGGRAFDMLVRTPAAAITDSDRRRVLDGKIMVLPSFPVGSGPFPQAVGRWKGVPATEGERLFAVSLYLALMARTDLDLIGARGDVVVEGPFGRNADFLAMLASLTGCRPVMSDDRVTGTSFGAACLALGVRKLELPVEISEPVEPDAAHLAYAEAWSTAVKDLE